MELSTRQNFALWLPGVRVLRGWARSVSGNMVEGISWIERFEERWWCAELHRLRGVFLGSKTLPSSVA
jgi:hypothetical protein